MAEPTEARPTPWSDPIVAEVRATRAVLWAAADGDIREFCRRAQEEQSGSGHPVIALPAKPDGRVHRGDVPHSKRAG
jgi:hypothetical protein